MTVSSAFEDHLEGPFQVESEVQEFALPPLVGRMEGSEFHRFTEGLEDPHE